MNGRGTRLSLTPFQSRNVTSERRQTRDGTEALIVWGADPLELACMCCGAAEVRRRRVGAADSGGRVL